MATDTARGRDAPTSGTGRPRIDAGPAPLDWQPTATRATLALRARLMAAMREFFRDRDVLEVETPLVVGAPVTDVHLHSARVDLGDGVARWLHTSPEYAMKRLLAAGSGDIWQCCKVVRGGDERGRLHNPEFTLVEWYRRDRTMAHLMAETCEFIDALLVAAGRPARGLVSLSYREALRRHAGVDPLEDDDATLLAAATRLGLAGPALEGAARDDLLDLLVATQVGPRLGFGALCALTHYPASQAALARLDPSDPRVALRFELYGDGIELANGFEELAEADEQAARFAADDARRVRLGRERLPADRRLLAALAAGLPPCSGVAVGFDRVTMLAAGAAHIDAVLPFPLERA